MKPKIKWFWIYIGFLIIYFSDFGVDTTRYRFFVDMEDDTVSVDTEKEEIEKPPIEEGVPTDVEN